MKLYGTKSTAKKHGDMIVGYTLCKFGNVLDHKDILNEILETESTKRHFYEYISKTVPVKLFLDIDIDRSKTDLSEESIITQIKELFPTYQKLIVLESHNETKYSYHILFDILDQDNNNVYYQNVSVVKELVQNVIKTSKLEISKYIDCSVYREGVFRTIYSTKEKGSYRPFVKSKYSDEFEDLDSFVTYLKEPYQIVCGVDQVEEIPNIQLTELNDSDIKIIKAYIKQKYHYKSKEILDIIINNEFNNITVALDDRECPLAGREHKSNHQYIIIDKNSSKQKCHDTECIGKHNVNNRTSYPKMIKYKK